MYTDEQLKSMSREELLNTVWKLYEEVVRLKNEVMYFENRNSLGLSSYNIPHFKEIQEMKERLNELSTEVQMLKENKK